MKLRRFGFGLLGLSLSAFASWSAAQRGGAGLEAEPGPLVAGFGPVFDVPDADFETPLDRELKVVFDVATGPDEPDRLNPSIVTLARFLNMHARAGVAAERLHVALVLHGNAGRHALDHSGYRERFGTDNPNLELLAALRAAGGRVILCGQTAASRGFGKKELAPTVELALSAMTALVALQQDGYQLIAF